VVTDLSMPLMMRMRAGLLPCHGGFRADAGRHSGRKLHANAGKHWRAVSGGCLKEDRVGSAGADFHTA